MTPRLRIAQVVCTDAFAGVERHVATLATGLAGEGNEVIVIGGRGELMKPLLDAERVAWLEGSTLAGAVSRLISLRHADVVHAHMTKAELAGVVISPLLRARVVTTRHFASHRGSSHAARVVGGLMAPHMTQLAVSSYVAKTTGEPMVVIPSGSPTHPNVPDAADRERLVLVAQRLEPEKRTDLALQAWKHSGLGDHGWRLELAGDGAERANLEALARDLGITGSCRFLGMQRDVEQWQRRAAILLAPCPIESFGLSVVEAMSIGLPVVAAAGGGHLETVGVTPGAALFPPGDPVVAGRMLTELANDLDRRQTYADALRAVHNREFSVQRQVSATLDVYRGLQR